MASPAATLDEPVEEVQCEAMLLHSGRPPMRLQFSTRSRLRTACVWHGVWEETQWQGYWGYTRRNEESASLEVAFGDFQRRIFKWRHIFKWKLDPLDDQVGYWATEDDTVCLASMPAGFNAQLEAAKRKYHDDATEALAEEIDAHEF